MDKKIIFGGILTIIVLIGIITLIMPTTANTDVPLEENHFNFLTISVPKGSDFSIEVDQGSSMAITNKGNYGKEAFAILTRDKNADASPGEYVFQNTTDNIEIYKHSKDDEYRVDKIVGNYRVVIRGTDLDLITNMINTAKTD